MNAMLPKRKQNNTVILSFAGLVIQAVFIVLFNRYRTNERKRHMNTEPNHKMVLAKTYTSGAEEWYCPTCGRRFIVQWAPEYQKAILELGDESVIHNTGKGAMIISQKQSDPWLSPWLDWLDRSNFESRWEDTPLE